MEIDPGTQERLRQEELFRLQIRSELEGSKPKSLKTEFWTIETFKWGVVALLIPLTTFVWQLFENHRADEKLALSHQAEVAKQDIDRVTALIPRLSSQVPLERDIARVVLVKLAAVNPSGATGALADEVNARLSASANIDDRVKGAEGAEILYRAEQAAAKAPQSSANTPDLSAAPIGTVVQTRPASTINPSYVYIHIYNENQRPGAEKLRDALRGDGIAVPGIENVLSTQGDRMLKGPQRTVIGVRYFHQPDASAAANLASRVSELAPDYGAPRLQAVLSASSDRVRSGLVEIWFPCRAAASGPPACV